MSQQAAAGRGAAAQGCGARRVARYFGKKGDPPSKGFKSAISKIANDTFNTGQNRFAAQFTQSRKNVANYLQRTASDKGYLVAETVRTGKLQTIALPPPIDMLASDAKDQKIIREEAVRAIAKRKAKLDSALKKGYATIWDQCSLEVRNKLEASDDWERTQREQSLHKLISKIERICVGFDDHKQEIFNLVQALKMLFLYTQTDKETVEEYTRNFKSLWDTVEAFGGSPGLQKGLVKGLL
jgi:methionine synthase II (cobalamin-independent)